MLLPTKSSKYNQVWRHVPEILVFRRLVLVENQMKNNVKLSSPGNSFVEVSGIEPWVLVGKYSATELHISLHNMFRLTFS